MFSIFNFCQMCRLQIMKAPASEELAYAVVYCVSQFCLEGPSLGYEACKQILFFMLEASFRDLQLPNAKADSLKAYSLKAVSHLSDENKDMIELMVNTNVVTSKLVSLLKMSNPSVLYQALRCLGNIVAGSDQQCQAVIDGGILDYVGKLMAHSQVRKQFEPFLLLCLVSPKMSHCLHCLLFLFLRHVYQKKHAGLFQISLTATTIILVRS